MMNTTRSKRGPKPGINPRNRKIYTLVDRLTYDELVKAAIRHRTTRADYIRQSLQVRLETE